MSGQQRTLGAAARRESPEEFDERLRPAARALAALLLSDLNRRPPPEDR